MPAAAASSHGLRSECADLPELLLSFSHVAKGASPHRCPPGQQVQNRESPVRKKSGFYRAGNHTCDNVLLQEQVKDNYRNDNHNQGCHNQAQVRRVGTIEHLCCNGQCIQLLLRQDQGRKEEVVPQTHSIQDNQRRRGRLKQRKHYLEKGLVPGAAVKPRRFLKRQRNAALDEAVIHEHGHGCGKSHMHQNQRQPVVQQVKLSAVNGNQRNHDYLERYYHGCNHQGKENFIQLVIGTHKDVCTHGGNNDYQKNADARDAQGIHERPGEIHFRKGLQIVGDGRAVASNQGKRFLDNISFRLKGVDYHHNKREHVDDKACQQYDHL